MVCKYMAAFLMAIIVTSTTEAPGQCQYLTLSGKSEELEKISFIDSMNGMIGTWEGVVLRTSDGGYTWTEQDIRYGSSLRIHSVSMASPLVAYAVTSEGEVYKTTDGGSNWVSRGFPILSYLYAVSFTDSNHGAVAGGAGRIGLTTDGGNSWSVKSPRGDVIFHNIAYVDTKKIIAVGSRGIIARSTDAGATWEMRLGVSSDVIYSVSILKNNTGYAVGANSLSMPIILKTTDGGNGWSDQSTTYDNILRDVSFLDSLRGVACGDGAILSTLDGGTTWQVHPIYGYSIINHIRYLSSGDLIAVGNHSSFNNNIIKISKNGCLSPFVSGSPRNLEDDVSLWKNLLSPGSVSFSWRFFAMVRFTAAHLQIGQESDFSGGLLTDTLITSIIDESDTTVNISGLSPKEPYYWRVSFRYLDGTPTGWSTINQFTTAGGMISGVVFEDTDRDSMRDSGEPTISNWPLQISGDAQVSFYTDGNGYYEVVGLDSGSYTVSDLGSPLWRRIKPDSGFYKLSLLPEDSLGGCDFGYYFPWNSVQGYVFIDANEDGMKSEGDSGLVSWRVRFAGPMGLDSTLSDAAGYYTFPRVTTGACTVYVHPPDGWEQIYPRLGKGYYHYFLDYSQQLELDFSFHRIPRRVKNILNFHDNRGKPVVKLQWGVRVGATNGIWGADPNGSLTDYSEGELEIPPPLPGAMDARFVSPPYTAYEFGLGSWIDMRPYISASQADTYVVRFSAGTYEGGDFPVTFYWSATGIQTAYSSSVWLSVPPELVIDMTEQDSIVISDPDLSVIRIIATGPNMPPDAVDHDGFQIPLECRLEQNYPNPFNPFTVINFALPNEGHITLKVYDVLGREVALLAEGNRPAGFHSVPWDAGTFGTGIYLYRLEVTGVGNLKARYTQFRKMLIVK